MHVIVPLALRQRHYELEGAEAVARTIPNAVIVRPTGLTNKRGSGRHRVEPHDSTNTSLQIPREDVAAFMVALISNTSWDGHRYLFSRPKHTVEPHEQVAYAPQKWRQAPAPHPLSEVQDEKTGRSRLPPKRLDSVRNAIGRTLGPLAAAAFGLYSALETIRTP